MSSPLQAIAANPTGLPSYAKLRFPQSATTRYMAPLPSLSGKKKNERWDKMGLDARTILVLGADDKSF